MSDRIARGVGSAALDIAYRLHGDPAHPCVMLVMGMGAQLIHWPATFIDALVARQLFVVRFDNRDAGRSTHLAATAMPDFNAAMSGDYRSVPYSLSDMAADATGLLDVLGIEAAHWVGASMGGAIAQTVAIEHPARARSLTSIMSTTGDGAVGQVHPTTMRAVFTGGEPVRTREAAAARAMRAFSVVGSPAFPANPADVAETAAHAFDRGYDEVAFVRQATASLASGDRTERLREVRIPTLVIHGLADTVCDPSGGRATAQAIPGATLHLVEGMGHDLPAPLHEDFADAIAGVVARGRMT